MEVQANKLHPLPIGGQDPVYAQVPVSLTVELDKDGVIQRLKGSEPTEKSIAAAVRYVQTVRDNGQLVDLSEKGSGEMANKSGFVQGATHEIRRDEKRRRVFQRTRFSVT
jgi:hypothetical protein